MDKKEPEKKKAVNYLKTRFAIILILVSLGYNAESVAFTDDDQVDGNSLFLNHEEPDESLTEEVKENHVSLAHIHLTGLLTETPTMDTFGLNGDKITSLKELVTRFDQARTDEQIAGVIVTTDHFSLGAGQGEEIYRALGNLHSSGKSVYVHVDRLDTLSYALFSSATHLSVVPTADVWLTGFYSESIYLKGLLDKLGVQADILHMGDYKAAGETFTRTEPSPEAEKNMQWLFDGFYGNLVDRISESRGFNLEQTRQLIDGGPYNDTEALMLKLVDSIQYRDAFITEIKSTYNEKVFVKNHYGDGGGLQVDMSNPFAFFSLFSSMMSDSAKSYKDSVAVIYIEGMILPGFGRPSLFGSDQNAYSGDIRKALEKAQEDPSVKAVVLRVDSPGGSALASEIILHACEKVKENKPLIVSMGNLAASGGYYVACKADHIWANPSTLTASIGVVGGKLVTTGMWNKLGVNWVPYKRGENADLLNSSSLFDEKQKAKMTIGIVTVQSVSGPAFLSRSINQRKIHCLIAGFQLHQQVKDFVNHVVWPCIRSVCFVNDNDWAEAMFERLAQYKASLRHRTFKGIHKQQHTICHFQDSFYFASKIRVSWRVDYVYLKFDTIRIDIVDGAVLAQNCNPPLPFQGIGVHN